MSVPPKQMPSPIPSPFYTPWSESRVAEAMKAMVRQANRNRRVAEIVANMRLAVKVWEGNPCKWKESDE